MYSSVSILCAKNVSTEVMVMAGTYSELLMPREGGSARQVTRCSVLYRLARTCKEMRLSCKPRCRRGDLLGIRAQRRNPTYKM